MYSYCLMFDKSEPTKVLGGKFPLEILSCKKSSVRHLWIFGCLCYAKNLVMTDKFVAGAIPSVLIGYSETQ